MFRNHLKVIFRKLRKERLYSFVNILGLTIGLMTVLLIALYVKDEFSFDQFHSDQEVTYRITTDHQRFGYRGAVVSDYVELISPDIPQIISYSRMGSVGGALSLIQHKEDKLNTEGVFYVDANFFEFFDFPMLSTSPSGGIYGDYQAIISTELKQKFFGEREAVGAEIKVNKGDKYTIVGVTDKIPKNSTIQFNLVLYKPDYFKNDFERNYGVNTCITYVKTEPGADIENLAKLINQSKEKPNYRMLLKDDLFGLLPLTDQRLHAPYERDFFSKNSISYVLLFSGIGVIILFLALINYVNLVTAQSINKMKEVGLRKVIGASRRQLMYYQLLESVILTTVSFILAFALAERVLPIFNELLGKDIVLNFFSRDFLVWVLLSGIQLGLIAGVYPAFFISRYKALSLISNHTTGVSGKGWLRKGLVLFQFATSAVLIIALVVMMNQMNYLKEKELGYNPELLLRIPLHSESKHLYAAFKSDMATISGVKSTSLNGFKLGRGMVAGIMDAPNEDGEGANSVAEQVVFGDKDFLETLEMDIIWTSTQFDKDKFEPGQVMINYSFAKKMGWTNGAEGKKLYGWNDKVGAKVVAIVSDFHSNTLKEAIKPMLIKPLGSWGTNQLFLRMEGVESAQVLKEAGKVYESFFDRPFEYNFFDDEMAAFYKKEAGQFKLFQVFSFLAVFISLLGLLALTVYMVEQRRKEVSIRKVLGASLKSLIVMLNKEYTLLVAGAFLIASPLAYYAMQDWLESFKYRIEVNPLLFFAAFGAFLLLSWSITVLQSWRVSGENPADVLRQD
ncbi:MAG: FtsX-like permease family protein [Roseivirga sp.]|nr:FtsX-like permease family protein [Roseivirga sp.]